MRSPYKEHLELDKRDSLLNEPFPEPMAPPLHKALDLATNQGIKLTSQYAFLLLHLKKVAQSKNVLGVNIPEVCLFYKGMPLELLYSEGG